MQIQIAYESETFKFYKIHNRRSDMRNHCIRPRRDYNCRYTFEPDQCNYNYYDYDYYDDYDRGNSCCRSRRDPARWAGYSEGRQNLNCCNGRSFRFNNSMSDPVGCFVLSRDQTEVTVRESGVYRLRYCISIPPNVVDNMVFFITENNAPISGTESYMRSGNCCGSVCRAEAVIRLRGGSRLSLRASNDFHSGAADPCTVIASMNIDRIR